MASSSAVQLADLAIQWSNARGCGDILLLDGDLASDRGLETAVAISLETDARAQPDDVPPSGDPNDRRGWWADEFATVEGDLIGSRRWLLHRSKRTNETALKEKQYCLEALAWMIQDKVVASVDVVVTETDNGMTTAITLQRPGRDPVTFRFAHVWDV